MPRIELITQLIEEYAAVDGISSADKIVGLETVYDVVATLLSMPANSAPQLPVVPGVILRDEPTEEVVGPGEWVADLTASNQILGLVVPGVGIVRTILAPGTPYTKAIRCEAEDALARDNLHGYHYETKHNITAEAVDGAECSEYLIVYELRTDVELFTWQSAVFDGKSIAEQNYEERVNRGRPVTLCAILPSGVPVVLKSHAEESC